MSWLLTVLRWLASLKKILFTERYSLFPSPADENGCSGGWFLPWPLHQAWDQPFSLFALFPLWFTRSESMFWLFSSSALLTDFALIPWCHLNKLEAGGGGERCEDSNDFSAAVVLGGKLIWCCYVSVIILSNHITGLGTARNNRREHSRYQRGATKIDCLFRYQIETLLLGYGKQPPPHSPFTRPCVLHTVFVRVHHPEVKGDTDSKLPGAPSQKESGESEDHERQWVLVDAWHFGDVPAGVRGSSLCLMFFPYACLLLFPVLPQPAPLPSPSLCFPSKSEKPRANSGGLWQILVAVPSPSRWVTGQMWNGYSCPVFSHTLSGSFFCPRSCAFLPAQRVPDLRNRVLSQPENGLHWVLHGTVDGWLRVWFGSSAPLLVLDRLYFLSITSLICKRGQRGLAQPVAVRIQVGTPRKAQRVVGKNVGSGVGICSQTLGVGSLCYDYLHRLLCDAVRGADLLIPQCPPLWSRIMLILIRRAESEIRLHILNV